MSENRKGVYFHSKGNLGMNFAFNALMNRRQSVFAESYNPEEDDFEPPLNPKTEEEKERILSGLKNHFLFRHVQEDDMDRIINAMLNKPVSKGEIIMREGDEGENFFFVDSGVYEEFVIEEEVPRVTSVYDNSGCFGELALMYNVPRASSVRAVTDGSLWTLDRRTFRRTILRGAYKKRLLYESFLESVPFLARLTEQERMNLAEALIDRTFEDGDHIVGEGEPVEGIYFVVSGCVVITRSQAGSKSQVEVKRLTKGQHFGEAAFVTKKPMSASACASGKVHITILEVEAFERLLGPCVQVLKRRFGEEELRDLIGSSLNSDDLPL